MKNWLERKFTLLTVLFHLLMLMVTTVALADYPDAFLGCVLALMAVYFVVLLVLYRRRVIPKGPVAAYMICTLLQFVLLDRVVPDVSAGAVSLGSGLALVFYILLLLGSCVVLGAVNGFKFAAARKGN